MNRCFFLLLSFIVSSFSSSSILVVVDRLQILQEIDEQSWIITTPQSSSDSFTSYLFASSSKIEAELLFANECMEKTILALRNMCESWIDTLWEQMADDDDDEHQRTYLSHVCRLSFPYPRILSPDHGQSIHYIHTTPPKSSRSHLDHLLRSIRTATLVTNEQILQSLVEKAWMMQKLLYKYDALLFSLFAQSEQHQYRSMQHFTQKLNTSMHFIIQEAIYLTETFFPLSIQREKQTYRFHQEYATIQYKRAASIQTITHSLLAVQGNWTMARWLPYVKPIEWILGILPILSLLTSSFHSLFSMSILVLVLTIPLLGMTMCLFLLCRRRKIR
jgi:hypothetical protein